MSFQDHKTRNTDLSGTTLTSQSDLSTLRQMLTDLPLAALRGSDVLTKELRLATLLEDLEDIRLAVVSGDYDQAYQHASTLLSEINAWVVNDSSTGDNGRLQVSRRVSSLVALLDLDRQNRQ